MNAQMPEGVTGSVALNSLMAMAGALAALALGCNDSGFVYSGPLVGRVAVRAGSGPMHLLGALIICAVGNAILVPMFLQTQNKWKIDDVQGVWLLHEPCGTWGGIAAGILGMRALGGKGGVAFSAYSYQGYGGGHGRHQRLADMGALKKAAGIRLDPEQE